MALMKDLMIRCKDFFLDHINWCHPKLSDGSDKPPSVLYDAWCLLFWPIPWMEDPCWCCASARGVVYGILIGLFLAW